MKNSRFLCLICSLVCWQVTAEAAELCGRVAQGEIALGKAAAGDEVLFNGSKINVSDEGAFLLVFGRDENQPQMLTIRGEEGEQSYRFDVSKTKWDVQNLKGVPPRKVTPSDADLAAIDLEQRVVRTALQTLNDTTAWKSGFIRPIEGRISGNFGGQRIMNNVPKNPHQGMDIAAPAGTEVAATADGEVVLAYPDLFYSGNVVIIDHGFGLQTIYAHLQEMKVKRGDKVKQGDIIGLVGKTGRVTGPHLHWGASLRNVRFNPQSLLDINTLQENCFTL